MNELIMPHNVGVKNVLDSMKEVLALYKKVTGNYRPMLDGERYLTDSFIVSGTWKNYWKNAIIQPIG